MNPSAERPVPDESAAPATWRSLAAALLGLLLLTAAVNFAFMAYLRRRPINLGYAIVGAKWNLLLERHTAPETLALGDSSCLQAVQTRLVAADLGGEALNLATQGDLLAVNSAWQLQWAVERLGPPRRVILVHAYDVWPRDESILRAMLGTIPLDGRFWRRLEPPLEMTWRETVSVSLFKYAPLYSQDQSLKHLLRRPRNFFHRKFPDIDATGYLAVHEADPRAVAAEVRAHKDFVRKGPFVMNPLNRAALRKMITLAEREPFDLYIAAPPLCEDLWNDPAFRAYYTEILREIEKEAARSARARLLFRQPLTFPANRMQNADHLIESSARDYTRRLIEAIRESERARGPSEETPARL